MTRPKRGELVILIAVSLFCLRHHSPEPPALKSPTTTVETNQKQAQTQHRQEWLIRESIAYALQEISGMSGSQARRIVEVVEQETDKYENIDCLRALGVILAESMGNNQALSSVGARGLMQVMPATGQFIAGRIQEKWEGRQSLYAVEKNIRYGVWYLNHLQEQFPDNERAMVAAYHWGPATIRQRLDEGSSLPRLYPNLVRDAEQRIERKMYEFYKEHYWWSLDLRRDSPSFKDDNPQSPNRSQPTKLFVHDAKGQLLPQGRGVQ